MSTRADTFWTEHWWKPFVILLAFVLIAFAALGIIGYKADLRAAQEACQERAGQVYEGLCITSPVERPEVTR